MKKIPLFFLCFFVGGVVGSFITLKSCGPDRAYWVKRAAYDEAVKDRQDRLDNALGLVAEKEIELRESDAALTIENGHVLELERAASSGARAMVKKDRELEMLKADAAVAIAANPAARRLVNAYEEQLANCKSQIFNLSKQVAELGVPVEAGTDPETGEKLWVYPAGTITGNLHRQYLAAAAQRDAWKDQYGEEHGLRLTCDALRTDLEHKLYGGKFWKWVAIGEPVVFGVIAIFGK